MEHSPQNILTYKFLLGLIVGITITAGSSSLIRYNRKRRRTGEHHHDLSFRPIEVRTDEVVKGVSGLIGDRNPKYIDYFIYDN